MYQTAAHLLAGGVPASRLWWLRMDHPVLMRESLGDLVRHVTELGAPPGEEEVVLLLDELVYAADWDLWLKTFYDDHWPVKVVATSSATALLRGRRPESGVGRWEEHFHMPYLFTEYLDLVGAAVQLAVHESLSATLAAVPRIDPSARDIQRLRERFLLLGGFPELITADRDALNAADPGEAALLSAQQTLRADAVERAIYKDIPQAYGVRPMLLERLLYVLAGQVTGVLSPAGICAELDNLTQPTFDRYLTYLEQTFLVFQLTNYSGSEASVQKRGRKLYFHDGAVRNAALQRGLAPLRDPAEIGVLIENLAASSLRTLALSAGGRLHHWRDRKHEVDLVYDHPNDPLAFEIGSSSRHSTTGLTAFQERHPRFAGRCYLVAPGLPVSPPRRGVAGVGTMSLEWFLIAVGRQAEAALDVSLGAPPARRNAT
jgi:predicted AAA+ superfamily ATPase